MRIEPKQGNTLSHDFKNTISKDGLRKNIHIKYSSLLSQFKTQFLSPSLLTVEVSKNKNNKHPQKGDKSMDARVILTPRTSIQISRKHQILNWLQANPSRCRNTNARVLASSMANEVEGSFDSIRLTIIQMVNNQMLFRRGTKRRAAFAINYLHKDIPKDVIGKAPKEDKELIARTLAKLDSKNYLDEVGCVCKKIERSEDEGEPKNCEEKQEATIESSLDMPKENTEQPIQVKTTADGLSVTITLNLNINK